MEKVWSSGKPLRISQGLSESSAGDVAGPIHGLSCNTPADDLNPISLKGLQVLDLI
jgi:hypothetical protein